MNENTIRERIAQINEQIDGTFDAVERATLSEELKELNKKLSAMKNKTEKKEVRLKTNIDAPIIGDNKHDNSVNGCKSIVPDSNGTFVSMI